MTILDHRAGPKICIAFYRIIHNLIRYIEIRQINFQMRIQQNSKTHNEINQKLFKIL
jgi:hypothetical protein